MTRRFLMILSVYLAVAQLLNAQDISSNAVINLPAAPQTTFSVPAGGTANIKSSVAVVLGPGTTLAAGSSVNIRIDGSALPSAPYNPAENYEKNWVYMREFDENGNEITASKEFFDNSGKKTQSQFKNESNGHVLANQTVYDFQGRPVISTLSAPINNSGFSYKDDFLASTGGGPYGFTSYLWDKLYNPQYPYKRAENPSPVDNSQKGGLGWYYSNNNTFEPFIAETAYPYQQADYYHDGNGELKRSGGIGEQLRLGSGHESASNSFPVQNELDNYLAIRNKFFPASQSGTAPVSLAGQALQNVAKDPNGNAVLSIADQSGKQIFMTARADNSSGAWLNVQNTFQLNNIAPIYTFITTNDQAYTVNNITVSSRDVVTVEPLYDHTSVTCGCTSPSFTGIGNDYVYSGNDKNSYKITSAYPFTVSETVFIPPLANPIVSFYDQAKGQLNEPNGSAIKYFYLTAATTVTISGSQYAVLKMDTEEDVTATYASGSVFPAGYYKVIANPNVISGINPSGNNDVAVSFNNKYSDISYRFYNQLGQMIGSITPNGVKMLLDNGLGAYANASVVPFMTTYEYDMQGRLTASTTTDGGRSEYVYRQDGQIRFSQNAAQRVAANAGTGNIEKFSYTNYDTFGRAIESGEYVVPTGAALTFASTKTNSILREKTGADDGLTGGTKQNQVNTYYDLPAANLAPSGYAQDAGFLRGEISYTTNANSTTWFNYDDHGRVTWTIKQLAGLTGYKTVNYTYNEQGNTRVVDYQKETISERFIHYYSYDADGRLTNVQTSTDGGTTKLQQAAYYYYLHGPLKRVELADNLQGIDYVYTAQGLLKSINHPSGDNAKDPGKDGNNAFAPDAFGMQVEYFPNDYSRMGTNITSIPTGQPSYYNGNVNGISWQSKKPSAIVGLPGNSGIQNPTMYTYGYDNKYQLSSATWGIPNFTSPAFTAGTMFKENGITYDANGNINSLQRTDKNGVLADDFSKYTYQSGTNKLTTVGNTAGDNNYATYTYDELGQLKSQKLIAGNISTYLKYDVTGKITGVYSDAAFTISKVTYSYDESGNRIKMVNPNGTTYYVYDANGNVMAIYSGTTPTITELPVYGADRLGTYFATGNNYYYELRDNVGSVKVVVNRNKVAGQADIVQYTDYYPFGAVARNGGVGYRYEYQGAYAEKDPATGYSNFDLRMYDGRIGRWLSIDPAGQYASPYEGMGNNPVIGFDPDGGWDEYNVDEQTGKRTWISDLGGDDFDLLHFGSYLTSGTYKGAFALTNNVYLDKTPPIASVVNDFQASGIKVYYIPGPPASGRAGTPIIDPIDFVGAFISGSFKALAIAGTREAEVLAAESGSQFLLKPAAANLTQTGLEHIVERHWFTSGAMRAGKFLNGTTGRELKEMINQATTNGVFRANTMGRAGTIAEYNFGRVIGTTSKGLSSSSLRVIIDASGNVKTAFPF